MWPLCSPEGGVPAFDTHSHHLQALGPLLRHTPDQEGTAMTGHHHQAHQLKVSHLLQHPVLPSTLGSPLQRELPLPPSPRAVAAPLASPPQRGAPAMLATTNASPDTCSGDPACSACISSNGSTGCLVLELTGAICEPMQQMSRAVPHL